MAVEGIIGVPKNSQDPLFPQTQDKPANARVLGSGNTENPAIREDTFTPSAPNGFDGAGAQDAGLFHFKQIGAPAADTAISSTAQTGGTIQGEAAAQNANAVGDPGAAPQGAGSVSPGAPAIRSQQGAATAPETQARTSAAATLEVQTKLQALNAALPALGLTNAQIQQIDRIATLVHNFNPAAYANMVNEFETQTQQAVKQSAANSAAGAPATALPGLVPNGARFQVQDIVIHLTGTPHSLNNASLVGGGQGTDGNSSLGAPAPLQVEQVQFRFVDGNGQTFQLSTPQRPSSATTTNP